MRPNRKYVGLAVALLLVFTFDALAVNPWAGRSFVLLVLGAVGLVLSPGWAWIPGILALPGDIMLIGRTPHSLDLLLWAVFVGGPYLVSTYVRPRLFSFLRRETDERSNAPEVDGPGDRDDGTPVPSISTEHRLNPSGVLEDMVVKALRRAGEDLHADNVLYFHVRQREASLGYLINGRGDIESRAVQARNGSRGVGWVLRHERQLIQRGRQVDWRNLRYHTRPVDLHEVHMYPIKHEHQCLGVVVLEWGDEPGVEEAAIETFLDDVQQLMQLDYSVRQMERNQQRFRLIEEVNQLHALSDRSFEALIHRALELMGQYVSAERIELFRTDRFEARETVLDQRTLLYKKSAEWVRERDDVLRVGNIRNHRLDGRRAGQFAPPDVRSYMAGPLDTDDGRLGVVCLDHPDEDYFSGADERLFRFFLDHLGTALTTGRRMESLRRRGQCLEGLFELMVDLGGADSLDDEAQNTVRRLADHFPVHGVGLYWKDGDSMALLGYEGGVMPTERISCSHALVRAVRDADHSGLVEFPDVSRFGDYESPADVSALRVIPIREGGRSLLGFLAFFGGEFEDENDELDASAGLMEKAAPLLARRLRRIHAQTELRRRVRRDSLTDLREFEDWTRRLAGELDDAPAGEVVLWSVTVPGWSRLCERLGRHRAASWLKRVTRHLESAADPDRFTRSHAATFVGYEFSSPESVEENLGTAVEELRDWSFPLGRWPESPRYRVTGFKRPFSDVEGMISDVMKPTGDEVLSSSEN